MHIFGTLWARNGTVLSIPPHFFWGILGTIWGRFGNFLRTFRKLFAHYSALLGMY